MPLSDGSPCQWMWRQTPPTHLFRQWSLKLTGFLWVKLPLGSPRFFALRCGSVLHGVVFPEKKGHPCPRKEPDDSRVVSIRLPDALLQRLDRYLDWRAPHRRLHSTRNAAIREALSAWLDQQEQLTGLLQPHTLRRQFQATYNSLRHHHDGVPISRLRELLQWPRERFDAVLEASALISKSNSKSSRTTTLGAQARQDSYHVHGQLYVRVRWRD